MARQYESRKKSGIRLYGFENFIEELKQAADISVKEAADKCFDQCGDIVVAAMDKRMSQAKVAKSLSSKAQTFRVKDNGYYMFAYGWNKKDAETFRKVCYLNYGTPPRWTDRGDWRGKIEARGFITNAKREASQRMKKVQKDALNEALKGLKK
ncbi:MAG: hypothetical protein J6S67_25515 [Methanobrevibacter sp.]|nr:hypothetical protein [Methanobrevibacter sp.]